MNEFLFVVVPYVCLTVFVVGHLWRYRYDKFGWTTRSSQLYENRLLRIGSPLFHFGMLGVVGGHVIGLLVPQSWTDALGISEHTYHVVAVAGGLLAGAMTVVGMAILIYRRRTTGPVFSATTTMDKVMYAVLGVVIVLGMWNTIAGSILTIGGEYNYREGVSVWYRSFLAFQPDADLMAEAPLGFQLHALAAFALFALWPFTRLVHVFSAPLGYLTRPYIVYRSRDDARSSAATDRVVAGTGSAEVRVDGSARGAQGTGGNMQKESLTALVRHHLEMAETATSGRSAHTVYGGHEHVLRQTLIALMAGRASTTTRTRARPPSRSCTAG